MGERLEDLMKSVLEDIKNQEYKQAYLFFGEEGYLKKQYRNKLLQAWNPDGDTMNESRFEGKGIDVKEVISLGETMPFFSDRRIILLENTGFFKNQCPELAEYLNNAGFKVTQATVSRDIRDLKLTKLSVNGGRQKYIVHRQEDDGMNEKYIRVLRDGFVSMDMAQNILVIKTVAGMAMAVAAAVDAMKWNEVVGCIAGDDTIMCAIRTVEDTAVVMENIRKLVSKKA